MLIGWCKNKQVVIIILNELKQVVVWCNNHTFILTFFVSPWIQSIALCFTMIQNNGTSSILRNTVVLTIIILLTHHCHKLSFYTRTSVSAFQQSDFNVWCDNSIRQKGFEYKVHENSHIVVCTQLCVGLSLMAQFQTAHLADVECWRNSACVTIKVIMRNLT